MAVLDGTNDVFVFFSAEESEGQIEILSYSFGFQFGGFYLSGEVHNSGEDLDPSELSFDVSNTFDIWTNPKTDETHVSGEFNTTALDFTSSQEAEILFATSIEYGLIAGLLS